MKRSICCIVLIAIMLFLVPLNAFATGQSDDCEVVSFDDGSYMIITIHAMESRASGTKSGSKTVNYYAEDGTLSWKAVLSGTFTYDGTTATCTASSMNVTVYNSAWYTVSKSASKSGASATGSVTMGKKLLGVTVAKVPKDLTLTCDANGNLS